jgi:hypothetical protein
MKPLMANEQYQYHWNNGDFAPDTRSLAEIWKAGRQAAGSTKATRVKVYCFKMGRGSGGYVYSAIWRIPESAKGYCERLSDEAAAAKGFGRVKAPEIGITSFWDTAAIEKRTWCKLKPGQRLVPIRTGSVGRPRLGTVKTREEEVGLARRKTPAGTLQIEGSSAEPLEMQSYEWLEVKNMEDAEILEDLLKRGG